MTRTRHDRLLTLAFLAAFVAVELSAAAAFARPRRDRDGTRLQAKRAKLDKAQKDSLSGEGDVHDWRFLEVDSAGTLNVSVDFKPLGSALTLQVTNAKGDVVAEVSKGEGKRALSVQTTPGIYYVHVGLTEDDKANKADYTITMSIK